MSPLWILLPISALAGVASALVFQRTTDRTAIRSAINLIMAHMLEFRLFLDEPRVILRAQFNLLRANLQMLRLILLPCLILAIPTLLLLNYLNATYGRAPLRIGEAVVLPASAKLPQGITIETPPLHFQQETVWRVRPTVTIPVSQLIRANPGVTIPFPPARILHLHWLVWFSLAFAIAAIGTACLL